MPPPQKANRPARVCFAVSRTVPGLLLSAAGTLSGFGSTSARNSCELHCLFSGLVATQTVHSGMRTVHESGDLLLSGRCQCCAFIRDPPCRCAYSNLFVAFGFGTS